MSEETYRPLPSYLTIRDSQIEGLGLFAKENIEKEKKIGISHIFWFAGSNGLMRTPLGGFINHSDTPNCEIRGKYKKYLHTLFDIKAGEELTVKYTSYKV